MSVRPTAGSGISSAELEIRFRHTPHWQMGGCVYFVTFRSARGNLPEGALGQVVVSVLHDHQKKYDLIFGVVMPDHVHLLLQPLEAGPRIYYDLSTIMKGIKGTSSRRINELLGTTGTVWQEGYFDRIVRDEAELRGKLAYMMNNPVKARLVVDSLEYRMFITPPKGCSEKGRTGVSGLPMCEGTDRAMNDASPPED
jgi:putative transposase